MSSGVAVRQEVADRFQEIKLKHCYRYILYKLTDDLREICVQKCADRGSTYEEFFHDLQEARSSGECRYAVYDAEYITDSGQQRNKLVFIMWAPDDAKLKQKMVYTSSKDAIKKKVEGIAKEVQATDNDEISWERILEVCKSTDR